MKNLDVLTYSLPFCEVHIKLQDSVHDWEADELRDARARKPNSGSVEPKALSM